jgi:hypothetical protein
VYFIVLYHYTESTSYNLQVSIFDSYNLVVIIDHYEPDFKNLSVLGCDAVFVGWVVTDVYRKIFSASSRIKEYKKMKALSVETSGTTPNDTT